MKDRAKWLYARKLQEMSHEMPFNKVKVKDLCERCDSSVQNFYYHFHDKYELAAWIYQQDSTKGIEFTLQNSYNVEGAKATYDIYLEHREFYWWVFNDPSHYNVGTYIRENMIEWERGLLVQACGTEALPPKLETLVIYHSYGMVSVLEDWILGRITLTSRELAEFQVENMPEPLLRALRREPVDASRYA